MTTLPHEPARTIHERSGRLQQLLVPEMWASLTIMVIWLSVLFDAVWGPAIETTTPGGTSSVPSAIVVALFAFLATWVVARHGFRHERSE